MLPCWLNLRSFKVHAAMRKAGKKNKKTRFGSKKERRRKLKIKFQEIAQGPLEQHLLKLQLVQLTSLPDMPEVAIQTQPIFTSSTHMWQN